jgi:acid stress-induced BolA-like protein IbaG/YrbA
VGIQELAEKLRGILEEGFHPAEIGLSTRDGIVAWIVSDQFESMDDLDRQEAVWNLLEKTLDPEERRAVSIVVALTSKEREFHRAGSL